MSRRRRRPPEPAAPEAPAPEAAPPEPLQLVPGACAICRVVSSPRALWRWRREGDVIGCDTCGQLFVWTGNIWKPTAGPQPLLPGQGNERSDGA